jgi:NAD(P)-dependent dehydrogenase (short-subunit alcohol dehydrogenase family)
MAGRILEGKVILVTGAGNGIGAEIAKLAAKQGAKVVVNDLGASQFGEGGDSRPAQRIVDAIKAAGGEAAPSFHSVAAWDSAHAIIDDALKVFGRIDGVVNNAGILRDVIFDKMTEDDWQSVIDVNLSGYFYISRAVANHFKAQGGGAFVHMTSTVGLIGNRAQVSYGAAKMGIVGLSKCIALDMEHFNVRSNCIAPFAYTRMSSTIVKDTEANKGRVAKLKTMGADKIAPLTVALLADQASDVNGQVFAVRNNEIVLFTQPRPMRTTQTSDGWTPESCLEIALPALRPSMYPLDTSSQVFTWDPF